MPAMPIADSSAPIVVGIRHTSSATRMTTVCSALANIANGCRLTVASRKMIVRPASRMLSAISFGVFWRDEPSTRAIIRSMNVSPGRAVIRTMISSDSTRVPPVTAERSPPDSRITGADSPVIADSSTLAMPWMTSPSLGIDLAGGHDDLVAQVELGARALLDRAVGEALAGDRLRPGLAQRLSLGLAPALGDRLGEVREQHREPQEQGDEEGEDVLVAGRRAEVLEEQDRRQHRTRPRPRTSPGCASTCAGSA